MLITLLSNTVTIIAPAIAVNERRKTSQASNYTIFLKQQSGKHIILIIVLIDKKCAILQTVSQYRIYSRNYK